MRALGKNTIAAGFAATLALVAVATLPVPALAAGPMAAAARNDDVDQARRLVSSGSDINLPDPDGTTPLLWAVYNTSPELVKLLLDAGADVNQGNTLDITPLLQASRNGNATLISMLLSAGANPKQSRPTTEPPLLAAARSGSIDAVKVLLEAGADPNATEPLDQQTALMWAVAEGHLDIARTLIAAGADVRAQARVSTLTKRKNADFPSGGFAALHWAARNGDVAMIDLLLANGADINVRNGDESTPMMLAIVNDRFDIAAKLLKEGADPNDGSLYFATEMRDATTDWRARDGTVFRADHPNELSALDLTSLLLDAGADPDKPFFGQMHNTSMCCDTKANSSPFFRAAIAADVEGLQLMLARGADVNWTPALEVKEENDLSDTPRGNVGKTALMMAINGGKGVGVAGGPNDLRYGPPDFRESGNRNTFEAARILLAAGANVNVSDPATQETALHLAVKALHPDIVKALVASGADLEARNKDGKTPLQLAEEMSPPVPNPGFYFEPPRAQPAEIAALLKQLSGPKTE